MALILSIDTSLEEAAVCIAEDKHILAVKKNSRQMDHAAWIQTAIKEMFSERKLSKFYLSDNYVSTIDFDGNLDLQIRMKQYNLLFKLTEPFAFNIYGPFIKPIYRVNADAKGR